MYIARFSLPSGCSIDIHASSAEELIKDLAKFGQTVSNAAPSATVTPEKQQAARDSTAKAQAVADLAKVKADIIEKNTTPAAETGKVAPTVDYPTLQKAVFELVGLVKKLELDPAEHVLGIAKSFNYANFAAMKEAGPAGAMHFADALAAVKAKHAELSEPAVA